MGVRARNAALFLHLTQGEDVALPDVPTEPLPEAPEAAKAEPGTADSLPFISHHEPSPDTPDIFVTDARIRFTSFSREEGGEEEAGQRDAGSLNQTVFMWLGACACRYRISSLSVSM